MKGTFITFEGIDGCGKSTQIARLVEALEMSDSEVVLVREPGGTRLSEDIRLLLLNPSNTEMCDECELLLYEASRAQLVQEVIRPALARGAIVLCDRFYDSTYAYQHGARGLDEQMVNEANVLGSCGLTPDCTLVFDLDPEIAFGRATSGGADRVEGEGLAFQRRVRESYLQLARREPDRVRLIDATGSPDEVFLRVAYELAHIAGISLSANM